jgi:hypothetical protein
VRGIKGDVVDAQGFVEILVGRDIAAAAFDDHFDIQLAVPVEGGNMNVRVQDLDVSVMDDVRRLGLGRALYLESYLFGLTPLDVEGDALDIQDDVGHILDNTWDCGELVQDALDAQGRDGRAVDGGQQDPPQGVSDRDTVPALKRLRPEPAVFLGQGVVIALQELGSLKTDLYHTPSF